MLDSRCHKNIIIAVALLCFALLPFTVKAATIYFSSSSENIFQGDMFVIEIKISSPDEPVNAVESTILFDKEKLEVKELSSGGSLFSVWLKEPAFSNQEGKVSFIGGTPNGFQGEEALILKIIFLAKNKGEAKLDFSDNTVLFLHDGSGTQVNPWLRPLTFNISESSLKMTPKDEWQLIIKEDKIPPEPFEILIGQDPSLFYNQHFISFFAVDAESGIGYYEVKEGDADFVRAGSPYLLKDQSLQSLITVKAVDKAGNERMEELVTVIPSAPFYENILFWVVVIIVIFLLIFCIAWKTLRRKLK